MYETHFGFHRQPFHSADASRAFFVSESIRTILPQLLHALRSDLGIAVLTGVPGSGKTSLLRHIQQQLSHEGRVLVCSGASLGTPVDLIGVLLQASRMKAGSESPTKPNAADSVLPTTRSSAMDHMRRTAELWGPILLLIDDAQLVPLAVLNELRACTEEEWNGRDLVRCLVSAPISFEEQLARSEYAEFCRRIRCHAFLQPLKSVESIRFLQEQIELAGGRLSKVLTTSALELIATAADGIPRCLSLLADETLVVAAECGEKIATEQSVRTALSRLQHLQYNWNASPHTDVSESPLSDDEDTAEEPIGHVASPAMMIAQVASPTITATVSRPTPAPATLSPGVIEFGGPSVNGANVRPATQAPSRLIKATRSSAVEPIIEVADREEDAVASLVRDPTPSSVFEFGIPQAIADFARSERVAIRHEASAPFEVGRRFFAESSEDSISIEDVDDSDIVNLLNPDGEFDCEPWGCITFPDTASPLISVNASSVPVQRVAPEIVWIDGNESLSEADSSEADVAAIGAIADDVLTPLEQAEFTEESSVSESSVSESELRSPPTKERFVAAANSPANFGFIDLGDSRMSNRTPVFDRYTWLALGREVPLGASSMVSQTKAKQLMLADCGMLATNQLARLCLQTASVLQQASINQIPITRTTDAILMNEILHRLPSREEGSFELFRNVRSAVHEISDHVPALSKNEASPAFLGLKIWQDGQLIFAQSADSDLADAVDGVDQHSGTIRDAVDEIPEQAPEPATKLGQSGFFTLPVPIEKVDWDLQSPGISGDHDVFPIVESITSLGADVRQFQQTGRITSNDSSGTERVFSPDAELTPDADTLISRAKRRLDDRTAVTDSPVVALQIAPDARAKRATAADSEVATVTTSNPGSAPQFSRLFTRLWENRRRAAGHTEADR